MAECLFISEHVDERFGAELDAVAPGVERVVLRRGEVVGPIDRVTAAYFSGDLYPDHTRDFWKPLFQVNGLRWLHSFSAGVDHPVFQRFRSSGAELTTSSGSSAIAIAQTVALYLLALSRDLPGWIDDQRARRWRSRSIEDMEGRTLLVLGLGPIGLEVARLGRALRMDVRGVRRTPRGDEPCDTRPFSELAALLPEADYVVLALPLTDETRHLLDGASLGRLKRGARVVNVGRGELIDENALVAAVEAGELGGAALDVFEVEPLPEASPLWKLPNVIVTPHSAGSAPGHFERATEIFLDNLARYLRGEPLLNRAP